MRINAEILKYLVNIAKTKRLPHKKLNVKVKQWCLLFKSDLDLQTNNLNLFIFISF